jgi:hypothetical protein
LYTKTGHFSFYDRQETTYDLTVRTRFRAGLFASLFLMINCGAAPTPMDSSDASAKTCEDNSSMPADGREQIILGSVSGGMDFQPMTDYDEFELERGIQGGQHILIALRVYALSSDRAQHQALLTDRHSGELLGRGLLSRNICTPGWNEVKEFAVFVMTASSADGLLQVNTELMNEEAEVEQTLRQEKRIRILGFN